MLLFTPLASFLFVAAPAAVEAPPAVEAPTPIREIYFEPRHVGLLSIAMLSGIGTSIPQLNRREAQWVSPGTFDRRAREAMNLSKVPGQTHRPSAITSDVLAFGIIPGAVLTGGLYWGLTGSLDRQSRWRYFRQDLAVVGETVGFTLTAVNVLKIGFGRQRPFVWAAGVDPTADLPSYAAEPDQNASFPSGHSALAFAVAVSGSTLASMRRAPHWRLAWLSLLPAAGAPLLRVAADKHYLSDVLVGSAIGAGVGVLMPLVVHNPALRKREVQVSLQPFHQGLQVGLRW